MYVKYIDKYLVLNWHIKAEKKNSVLHVFVNCNEELKKLVKLTIKKHF